MQIIARHLLHARRYVSIEEIEINMPDTEERVKKSTSHSHLKKEETEADEG